MKPGIRKKEDRVPLDRLFAEHKSKMKIWVAKQELIECPRTSLAPHVVLLGAGASRAAFPNGDRLFQPIPLMNDLVEILKIRPILEQAGRFESDNFELIYARLVDDPQHDEIRKQVDRRIENYFLSLELPEKATLYDRIVLSLKQGDAIFTFNWDPFLFDAYTRNFCLGCCAPQKVDPALIIRFRACAPTQAH